MSIVTTPEPCIQCLVGTEHRDRGEPIPARPPAVRRPRPFSPSQAEAEATAVAERAAGANAPLGAFKAGAYESLYGELYQHFLDARAEAERYRRGYYPFFSDELELPDAELDSTEIAT